MLHGSVAKGEAAEAVRVPGGRDALGQDGGVLDVLTSHVEGEASVVTRWW